VPVPLPANARSGAEPAPGGLELVQELLNTVAKPSRGFADLLADAAAQAWCDAVLAARGMPAARIDDADAAALRRLRSALASAIRVRDGREVAPLATSAPVELRLGVDGAVVIGASADAPAVAGLVLAEVFAAQARGDWHRLKLCALDACSSAFYDRSRNGSARYHELRCANHVNLRNSRQRRRDAADGDGPATG
jgi:predicted RNA-binding Zn ribbon-like protein